MGGSSGGRVSMEALIKLEERAKESLKKSQELSPHVFISFAYEDNDEVNLLRGQAKNSNSDLQFDDYSVKEAYDSASADYIKKQIQWKIEKVSVTVVYLSGHSANSKWVDWEIRESIRQGKGVVGVYVGDAPPKNLPSAWESKFKIVKWEHAALMKAIEQASQKR